MARRQGGTLSGFTPLSTPNAPTNLSVSAGIGSATVSFTAPEDTGDAEITSYIVTSVDESTGASTGTVTSSTSVSLTPTPGSTFKVRAQAINAFGPGRLTEFNTGNSVFSGASLWSVGSNDSGLLGINTYYNKSSPVQIGALTDWSKVSDGAFHACAIKTDGTLWSWGSNNIGQLGLNNTINKSSPNQVGALTNWASLCPGSGTYAFSAAIKTDGTLWSWGLNNRGQLGQNDRVNRSSPTQIGTLTSWASIASGNQQMFAIKTDGTLWSWGYNYSGELGQNDRVNRSSPTQVGTLSNWSFVAAASENTGAIKTDGTLWMWGQNGNGSLGVPDSVLRSSPVQVGSMTDWKFLAVGNKAGSAIKTDGTLWSWGFNADGQLGQNDRVNRSSPVQVGALTDWKQTAMGNSGSVHAVRTNGTWWSWGFNVTGVLGQNDTVPRSSPTQVGSLTSWVSVSNSQQAAFALYGIV